MPWFVHYYSAASIIYNVLIVGKRNSHTALERLFFNKKGIKMTDTEKEIKLKLRG